MNTSNVIPKEELPTYQRWKFNTLTHDSKVADEVKSNAPIEKEYAQDANTKDIYRQAKEEGHAAGFKEGHLTGYQEGRQLGKDEVKTEIERMHRLISVLNQEISEIDKNVAQDLLTLALDLSKKMTAQALQIHPELIIPIVQEAMRHLPHTTRHAHLILHPDDAALVRDHLGEQLAQADWEICEDEQMPMGGCKITSNGSEIDASISTRWQQIVATIGQQDAWLATSSVQPID